MAIGKSMRQTGIMVLVLFVSSTFVPPEVLAWCSDECHEVCVEPVRIPHTVCVTQPVHRCGSPETCDTGIAHHHMPTGDVPVDRSTGYTQDEERLPGTGKICAASLAGRLFGINGVPDPKVCTSGAFGREAFCDSVVELIQSVVLLI